MLRPLWRYVGCCVCLQQRPEPHQAWPASSVRQERASFYLHTGHPLCPLGGSPNPLAFGHDSCTELLLGRGLAGPRPPVTEGWAAGTAHERGFPPTAWAACSRRMVSPLSSPGTGAAALLGSRAHSSIHSAVTPPWRWGSRISPLLGLCNCTGSPKGELQYVR